LSRQKPSKKPSIKIQFISIYIECKQKIVLDIFWIFSNLALRTVWCQIWHRKGISHKLLLLLNMWTWPKLLYRTKQRVKELIIVRFIVWSVPSELSCLPDTATIYCSFPLLVMVLTQTFGINLIGA
jgi:hypothetical protein